LAIRPGARNRPIAVGESERCCQDNPLLPSIGWTIGAGWRLRPWTSGRLAYAGHRPGRKLPREPGTFGPVFELAHADGPQIAGRLSS
jgi:hypothetical protein